MFETHVFARSTAHSAVLYWDKPAAAGAGAQYTVYLGGQPVATCGRTHFTLTDLRSQSDYQADVFFGHQCVGSCVFRTTPVKNRLDVTEAPFWAKGDGKTKNTAALQREESRECYINTAENAGNDYKSEFYCIGKSKDSKESSSDYLEAVTVANRIKELVDSHFKVYDGNGKYRDLKYSDIVVLMRSTKVNGELLQEILESNNIPSFLQKEEYFEKREIKLMLTLISLINNHIQDIPLVSVMRSPIGNFTENELSKIRLENRASSFYNAVKYYKSSSDDLTKEEQKLSKKCKSFLKDLDRWRGYVKMKSIAALIWTLYEETGFYDFMGALEGGDEAQANLKLLYERARKYEESGFKGIFNFIRYIERIEKRNEDLSGAQLINENHNVVRIMTIHKSKGLEFPVVFIMRTTKNMLAAKPTEEHRIQLHKDLGIGIDYINYERW